MSRVARAGAGSAWGLGAVDEALAARPHLVLVELAVNDADLLDGVPLRRSVANHRAILARLRPGAGVMLMTMSPAQGPRGWVRPRLGAYYAAYGPLAAEAGAGLLDLYPRWLALPRAERGLGADGLHPEGEVAAAVIVPPLVEAVAAALGRDCP